MTALSPALADLFTTDGTLASALETGPCDTLMITCWPGAAPSPAAGTCPMTLPAATDGLWAMITTGTSPADWIADFAAASDCPVTDGA